jgi:hypothetical protein
MMDRQLIVKRLASNITLKHVGDGEKERLINTIARDIDALVFKNARVGNRVWNRVEWKLVNRDFSVHAIAIWKNIFYGIKREVEKEIDFGY